MGLVIATTSQTGAGCLKQAGLAGDVIGFGHSLVDGPQPRAETPGAGFAARAALLGGDATPALLADADAAAAFEALERALRSAERLELWVDPTANAQLMLLQWTDWLSGAVAFDGVVAVMACDARLAAQDPKTLAAGASTPRPLDAPLRALARDAWDAYRAPTPAAWAALRSRDFSAWPSLAELVPRLLAELPHVGSGLSATEAGMLARVAAGGETAKTLLLSDEIRDGVFDYWRNGEILVGLAENAPRGAAIAGLAETEFSDRLHQSARRLRAFWASDLTVTEAGAAYQAGRADFFLDNNRRGWWGGTELTPEQLWRWDPVAEALVAPE